MFLNDQTTPIVLNKNFLEQKQQMTIKSVLFTYAVLAQKFSRSKPRSVKYIVLFETEYMIRVL